MSQDTFIYFKPELFPSKETVEFSLKKYFSSAAKIEWNEEQSRFYILLEGKPSSVFPKPEGYLNKERWFEVFYDKEDYSLDVITRTQDEYTKDLAMSFVSICVRLWDGKYNEQYR